MTDFPGFPSNNFDFHFDEVGAALAGLLVRDINGVPRSGLLPSREDLVRTRNDWFLDYSPFVAVRTVDNSKVLIGGTTEAGQIPITPAPSANSRIDVIWTRPADMDAGESVMPLQVAEGLAAAVPQKPAIPAGAVEVATFTLSGGTPNTAGGVLALTFDETATAGGVLKFRSISLMQSYSGSPGQLALVGTRLFCRSAPSWLEIISRREFNSVLFNPRAVAAGAIVTATYTFPEGTFAAPPHVVAGVQGAAYAGISVSVTNVTATSVTVNFINGSAASRSFGAYLIATR